MLKPRTIATLGFATLLAAFQLSAQAADVIEIKTVAEKEVETVRDGKKQRVRMPVVKAVPGDEIVYTTTFRNMIDKPVGNIVITNPVPNDSLYKSDSAKGDSTDITFSADGGKQYAEAGKLSVKGRDGKARPALAADYTHIRWSYKGQLAAGKSGEVSFRAVIK